MSYLIQEEIPCTHCKFPNAVEVWSIVNVKEDPELKAILLGGELNMAECTSCKKIFYAEHFVLYHDPEAELMAFVYPYDNRSDIKAYEEKTRVDFELSQENSVQSNKLLYRPMTLFGLDELIQLLEREEEEAIQGEIVQVLAGQLGLTVKKLRPSLARRQELPSVLPFRNGSSPADRTSLLMGIESIQKANDRLTVYTALREKLVQNPALEIRVE